MALKSIPSRTSETPTTTAKVFVRCYPLFPIFLQGLRNAKAAVFEIARPGHGLGHP